MLESLRTLPSLPSPLVSLNGPNHIAGTAAPPPSLSVRCDVPDGILFVIQMPLLAMRCTRKIVIAMPDNVPNVLRVRPPAQISGTIVFLVAINVADLKALRGQAVESGSYYPVDGQRPPQVVVI